MGSRFVCLKILQHPFTPSSFFYLSLVTGSIPYAWKFSRIIPIFKADGPPATTNYRLISLQPICAKLLKKVIHRNILDRFENNDILTKRHFGFLSISSTSDALITALHDWYGSISRQEEYFDGSFRSTQTI